MHDNHTLPYFGAVYEWDSHMGEYTGGVNWERFMKTLAAVGYTGDFTFEADNFFQNLPAENAADASRFMCDVGRYLIGIYESAKEATVK
jgi:sugar phosphate isomerase/epimerase